MQTGRGKARETGRKIERERGTDKTERKKEEGRNLVKVEHLAVLTVEKLALRKNGRNILKTSSGI